MSRAGERECYATVARVSAEEGEAAGEEEAGMPEIAGGVDGVAHVLLSLNKKGLIL
ncbi:MAG: hypothetical protein V3V07_04050 [candidate division NC10 bacterium]